MIRATCITVLVIVSVAAVGLGGEEKPDFESLFKAARVEALAGRYAEAERLLRAAEKLHDADDLLKRARWCEGMATILAWQNRHQETVRYFEEALKIREGIPDRRRNVEAEILRRLAISHRSLGHPENAVNCGTRAVRRASESKGPESTLVAEARMVLGLALSDVARLGDAKAELEQAIAIFAKNGKRKETADGYAHLGRLLIHLDYERAVEILQHSVKLIRAQKRTRSWVYRYALAGLAELECLRGRIGPAEKSLLFILGAADAQGARDSRDASVRLQLALLRLECGRVDGVGDLLRAASRWLPVPAGTASARLAALEGRWKDVWPRLEAAAKAVATDGHGGIQVRILRGEALLLAGRGEDAAAILEKVLVDLRAFRPLDDGTRALENLQVLCLLAEASLQAASLETAQTAVRDARELIGAFKFPPPISNARIEICRARLYERKGEPDEALSRYREARVLLGRTGGVFPGLTGTCRLGEARILRAKGKHDGAVLSYRGCLVSLAKAPTVTADLTREVRLEFAKYLEEQGKPEEAKKLRAPSGT